MICLSICSSKNKKPNHPNKTLTTQQCLANTCSSFALNALFLWLDTRFVGKNT
jgi:hypothetical protein